MTMPRTIRTPFPVLGIVALVACGGSRVKGEANSASVAIADAGDAYALASAQDSGDGAPARPFASNSLEATTMVNAAIDDRSGPLGQCVVAARARRRNEHGRIVFEVGVDQEGVLIGVKTPKGQRDDPILNECVRTVLAGAAFPRSHAGVITVQRSVEDQQVPR